MLDRLIQESIAPARVRSALDKLLASGEPLACTDEATLTRFVRVTEVSRFAAEILRRYDAGWSILATGEYVPGAVADAESLRRELALALFHVIVVDVLGPAPFLATLPLLSDCADRAVAQALALAEEPLVQNYGQPAIGAGFCVLGMGKLGGRELNFSSDIDLIFLYREDGETAGGSRGRIDHAQWCTKLAEKAVELLSSRLISPIALRVDLRLRPEGASGPLVRSLESMLAYYEHEGSVWERQALLKARPVAGDRTLGEEFLAGVRPFIYRRYLDQEAVEQIEAIKARIETQAAEHGARNVKLSRGGIREIEFIVQLMQLANGGRCADVRSASTLDALDRLVANRYLMESERDELRAHYLFLRRVEHRLQMLDGRQTQMLPADEGEMDLLARGLGYAGGDELWQEYRERTEDVRRFYERRFSASREIAVSAVEERIMEVLDEGADPQRQLAAVQALGLPESAMRELRSLARGSFGDPATGSVRRLFLHSAAVWMPLLQALPEPGETLTRFGRMVESYGAKALLYDIFASHQDVAELVIDIAALSRPLTEQIAHDPSTLEALLSPGGVTAERTPAELVARRAALASSGMPAKRVNLAIKAEENLRVGVRFLLGLSSAAELGRELSTMVELLLGEPEFGVIALGRFGDRCLGPGSDLDLVFVTENDPVEVAAEVRKKTEEWQALGLKIDSRLRPMGRTSPLVAHVDALAAYLDKEAETWERVAWTHARVVGGAPELRARLGGMIERFVFEKPFGPDERRLVKEMRQRLLDEAGASDLKRGPGGLIGIDFMLAARRIATRAPEFDAAKLLADRPDILKAWRFLRALDTAARLAHGKPYRGDETDSERARLAVLMERHKWRLEDLAAQQAVVDRAFAEEFKD